MGKGLYIFGVCTILLIITVGCILGQLLFIDDDEACAYSYDYDPGFDSEILTEGVYMKQYPRTVLCLKRTVQDISLTGSNELPCLTNDGIEINLQINIQHQRLINETRSILEAHGSQEAHDEYLFQISRNVLRDVCSNYNVSEFYLSRENVQTEMLTTIKQIAVTYKTYTDFLLLQLLNVEFPTAIVNAIEAVQTAEQDILQANEEREAALTEAEEALQLAIESATIRGIQAAAQAEAIRLDGEQQESIIRTEWEARIQAFSYIKSALGMTGEEFVNIYLRNEALKQSDSVTISVD